MKKLCLLVVALSMMLSGCGGFLEREYQSVEPYFETPVNIDGESTIMQVESYTELVNAVLSFVSLGMYEGVIELVDYTNDVEGDLAQACAEVMEEDPLGSYLVEDIQYRYTRMDTSYETTLTISYFHEQDKIDEIVSTVGESAVRRALEGALGSFSEELLLRVTYFDQDEAYIQQIVVDSYYANPVLAFGLPEVEVTFYPETGTERIAEIAFVYPLTPAVQEERASELSDALADWVGSLMALPAEEQWSAMVSRLTEEVEVLTEDSLLQGNTPWNVLVQGVGDDEGLALTVQLLCQELDIPCTLIEGIYLRETHYWNYFPEGVIAGQYLDLTQDINGGLLDAVTLAQMGYLWQDGYPTADALMQAQAALDQMQENALDDTLKNIDQDNPDLQELQEE